MERYMDKKYCYCKKTLVLLTANYIYSHVVITRKVWENLFFLQKLPQIITSENWIKIISLSLERCGHRKGKHLTVDFAFANVGFMNGSIFNKESQSLGEPS